MKKLFKNRFKKTLPGRDSLPGTQAAGKKVKYYILIIIPLLFACMLRAQQVTYTPVCTLPASVYNTVSVTAQPPDCWRLKYAFVPTPADCVLTVNLRVWVFNDDNGNGCYSTTTETDVAHMVEVLNYNYANLQPPYHPKSNAVVPFVADSKIRFALVNPNQPHIYNCTSCYENYADFSTHFDDDIHDCNAINIVYSKIIPNNIVGPSTKFMPGKYIFMPADVGLDADGLPRQPDNDLWIKAITHELGHALGVDHTNIGTAPAAAMPEMGGGNCCEVILVDDVEMEGQVAYNSHGYCLPASTPVTQQVFSNNFMSNNARCKSYLSPSQLAIMHYHLRTDMKDVLTPQGYANAMHANHAFDVNVTSNDVWTTDRYHKGNVTVKPGVSLSIECNVAMTQYGKFIVEPGAQLIVENGAKITNISGHVWSGIEVAGAYNKNQSLNGYGHGNFQGMLRVRSNATISHAENAVKNYSTNAAGNIAWNSIGGIIIASDANFINNSRDAEFLAYTYAPGISRFDNCTFKTTGEIGKYGPGNYAQPLFHVSLWGIEGVKFRSCNFEYAAGNLFTDPGMGIFSADAVYSVDKTGSINPMTFKNLSTGVRVENSNPLKVVSVKHSTFINNANDAVYFQNMNNIEFEANTITAKLSNGLYLYNCKDYMVKNNSFTDQTYNKASTGIYANNSVDGSHQLYRNTFSNLALGIGAIGNNSSFSNNTTGLKMNCNNFGGTPNDYDINMFQGFNSNVIIPPTVMTNQGKPSIPYYSASDAVRNIYGALSGCNTCENQWFIEGTSAKTVKHPVTTVANTQPLPQPAMSDHSVQVIYTGLSFNFASDCLYNPSSSGNNPTLTVTPSPSQRLAYTHEYLSGLFENNVGGEYQFEIGATLATQLNLFLTDSVLQNKDSVIAILATRADYIPDADILTIYAYMHKGDLRTAEAMIQALPADHIWKALLLRQINWQADPESLYNLQRSADDVAFLNAHTAYDSIGGSAAARSLLHFFTGKSFAEPKPFPARSVAGRLMQQQAAAEANESIVQAMAAGISVYPNPASELVSVSYQNAGGQSLQVVMTDALGRRVYEAALRPGATLSIPLTGMPNGIYLLNAYSNKTSVYQGKVICIK